MKKITVKNVLVTLLGLILLIAFAYLYQDIKPYINEGEIKRTVLKAGPLAPLAFVLFAMCTNVIPPFPVVPFWLVAIAIFDPVVAYGSILSANILGNTANFLISRYFGYPVVRKLVGKRNLERVKKYTDIKDFKTFLLYRIFGGGLTDYISYAAGFTSMTIKEYLLATIIGLTIITTPAFILIKYGLAGKATDTIGYLGVVYILNYGITLSLPAILIYKKRKKQLR